MQDLTCDSNLSTPQQSPQKNQSDGNALVQVVHLTTTDQTDRSSAPMKKNDSGYYYYKHAYETNNTTVSQGHQITRDVQIRDWNNEFQNIVDGLYESDENAKLEKYKQLSHLAQDFVYVAKTYGKIIILERYSTIKTIPSVAIGGLAGGDKFIVQFSVDKYGIYGGDENALKAAGNELRGLASYYKCHIPGLHFPLMSLIDYRGFRLIAMSILPIVSLVYGSNDGGVTVYADDPVMNEKMQMAAKKLNVKGHTVGMRNSQQFIHGPTDIEEYPKEGQPKRSVLYNQLRPEFLASYGIPLSSDAMSGFGKHNMEVHNEELKLATEVLHKTVIPKFALVLDCQDVSKLRLLTEMMHREGINIRHLGLVRSHVNSPNMRKFLLLEMISRVIKNTIRKRMRKLMEQIKIPSQEPYKQDITDYLNLLFGKNEESKTYWREGIKSEIIASFGEKSLFPEEKSKDYPLNHGFETENLLSLLHRVQHLAGVKISTRALQQFSKANDACFVYPDITKISAKVKDMNITAHAEGMSLYMESMQRKGEEGDRLFFLAMRRFEAALSSTLDNHVTVKSWGDALLHQAIRKYGDARIKLAMQATEKYLTIENHEALVILGLNKEIVHFLLGNHLLALALKEGGPERDRLLEISEKNFEAASKCVKNVVNRKDVYNIYVLWGNALAYQARTVNSEKRESLLEEAGKKYFHALKYVDPTNILYSISQKSPKNRDLVAIMQAYQIDENMCCVDERISNLLSDSSVSIISQEFCKSISKLCLSSCLSITPNALSSSLPSLLELDLSDSHANDELIKQINRNCKNLKILRLSSTKISQFPISELMEKLEELNLQDCRKLTNLALVNIGTYCPQLKSLNISGTSASIVEEAFLTLLKGCKEINNLDISNCKKLSSDAVILGIAKSLSDLQSINLGYLLFTKESFSAIPTNCKKLVNVKLAGCTQIMDSNVIEIADNCTSLEVLDLLKCKNISNVSILKVAEKCTQLKHLRIHECSKISDAPIVALASRCPGLTSLEMGGVFKLSGESISAISKYCTQLQTLNVYACEKISDDSLIQLAENCKSLTSIVLRDNNKVSEAVVNSIAKHCTGLHKLHLSNCKMIGNGSLVEIANSCSSIQAISLGWNTRFTADLLVDLAVKSNLSLKKVDLRECKQVDDTFIIEFANYCPNLEDIWLDSCYKVTDAGIMKLAQYCSLKLLRLAGCYKITDFAVTKIAVYSPNLQILSLARCYKVTDASVIKLKFCKYLQVLSLVGCKHVSDASIFHLGACSQLQKLTVDSCPQVSAEAVQELKKKVPLLEVSMKNP